MGLRIRGVEGHTRGHGQHPRLSDGQHAEDAQADARLGAVPAPGGVQLPVVRGEGLILRGRGGKTAGAGWGAFQEGTQRSTWASYPCWQMERAAHGGACGLPWCCCRGGRACRPLLHCYRPTCTESHQMVERHHFSLLSPGTAPAPRTARSRGSRPPSRRRWPASSRPAPHGPAPPPSPTCQLACLLAWIQSLSWV